MAGRETHFEDRTAENQSKLRAFDALEKPRAEQAKQDAKSQIAAFDQAFKTSEQQRKISATEERLGIARERNDLTERQRVVSEQLAAMKQKESEVKMAEAQASMALMQHKLESTKAVAEQTTGMFTDMEKMRDEKGFLSPSSIAKLRATYPDAAMHANNAQALDHEVRRFDDAKKLDDAVPKPPTPDQAGFISRYKNTVQGVHDVQPILQKAGLNINSKWDSSTSDFQKAVDAGKITHDEASLANGAIYNFRNAVQTGDTPITNLQPHFDEISGKLSALTPKVSAAPPATQSTPSGVVPPTTPPTDTTTAAPAPDAGDIHGVAREAIKNGADPEAVKARLVKLGGDPSKL